MNFYKHFLGDYARDTADLSLLEHGAYRVLLDHYYAQRGNMPADLGKLHLVCKARTPAERKAVEAVADRFFMVNGDGRRHNKRADVEISEAEAKSAKAKGSAERRWIRTPDADADEMRTHSDGNASQSQKPEKAKASPATAGEGRDAVAAVPDCPHEKLVALYHATLPTCTPVVEWNDERRAIARARWREKGNAKPGYRTVEDGLAYWQRYFEYVSGSKFLTGKADPTPGRKPFVASLEWLHSPEELRESRGGHLPHLKKSPGGN
jgi:uncharacterized protein YdaU (DUF1376 family)